jgi:hypothetical protein
MGSLPIRILLFLSSYFPLFAIFFVQLLNDCLPLALFFLGLGSLGIVGTIIYLAVLNTIEPEPLKVAEVRKRGAEAMGYVVGYLIPFLDVPLDGLEQWIALGVFLFVLGVLYVTSNMVYLNPMLNLAGYHLYEVKFTNGTTRFLITRRSRRMLPGENLKVVEVGEDVVVEKRK